jgi:hypothetical protein
MSVDVEWIKLAHDGILWWAHVNAVTNLWIPKEAGHFLTSRAAVRFSRRTPHFYYYHHYHQQHTTVKELAHFKSLLLLVVVCSVLGHRRSDRPFQEIV